MRAYPMGAPPHVNMGPSSLPVNTGSQPFLPHSVLPPGGSAGGGGGYTLPPTAAYFPMSAYSAGPMTGPQQSKILEGAALDSEGMTQPNTPDLLMHRRQVNFRRTQEQAKVSI